MAEKRNVFARVFDRLLWRRRPKLLPPPPNEAGEGSSLYLPAALPALPNGRSGDSLRLARTPGIEHAFRSIARNPSRYREQLSALYLADPDERTRLASDWFRQEFPAAWQEALDQYASLRPELPRALDAEDEFMTAVAQSWGDLLVAWTGYLSEASPNFHFT